MEPTKKHHLHPHLHLGSSHFGGGGGRVVEEWCPLFPVARPWVQSLTFLRACLFQVVAQLPSDLPRRCPISPYPLPGVTLLPSALLGDA